jgi:PhnB protein
MNIPDHYQPIMPYLVVENADDFIGFITTVFDAEEKLRVNRNEDGSLMHGEYSINGGTIMLGQSSAEWKPFPCAMYIVTENVDEVYQKGVANGAIGNQEPGERGYGRSAGFLDRWGNQWWLNDPETREEE